MKELLDHVKTFCRMKPFVAYNDQYQTPLSNMNQKIFAQAKKSSDSIQFETLRAIGDENGKRLFRFKAATPTAAFFLPDSADSHIFQVDGVLDDKASQEQVFEEVAKPLLEPFFKGVNTCVCCYGQTGAGKTWTLSGGDTFDSRGLIQRTIERLFFLAKDLKEKVNIFVSYMEIYNEVIYDLLGDTAEEETDLESFPRVQLQEDETGTVHTRNLTLHAVSSAEEATDMFLFGNMNRIVSSTLMNQASSRSHCVFTIYCESSGPASESSSVIRSSKLHMVDLAGSERVYKTGLSGTNLREARYINKSLHFLEQVMSALYQKKSHIPYRNSVLTSVLRESLGGNCRTVLIGNVSLDSVNMRETLSTCRFIERCGQIERKVFANIEVLVNPGLDSKNSIVQGAFPLKPPGSGTNFCFISETAPAKSHSIRELQDMCGSNLSQFPKELRKQLIEKLRDEGMEYRVSCVGDLAAIAQVLLAKLTQSDIEKQELRDRLNEIPVVSVSLPPAVEWRKSSGDHELTKDLSN
jgi:hypothetical protein